MTPEERLLWERLLWERLRRSQLHGLRFRRQQVIDGFIVDFYCATANLAVEVDGPVHDKQTEYDTEREKIITSRQIRILRISNEAVRQDISAVLAQVAAYATKQALDG